MSVLLETPELQVSWANRPLNDREAEALGQIWIHQSLSLPTQCVLRFFESAHGERLEVEPGRSLEVALRGESTVLFRGEITALEYVEGPARERELRVRAYDPLHRLRKQYQVRAHVDVTPKGIAGDMAGQVGLSVTARDTGPSWKYMIQSGQSNFDFLLEVLSRAGLYAHVRDSKLQLFSLKGLSEERELVLGENLFEATSEVNSEEACRSVTARGWDPGLAEPRHGRSTSARDGRKVDAHADPGRFGSSGEVLLVNEPVQEDRQAQALAQAEQDRRAAVEVVWRGVAQGDTQLCPGVGVKVRGMASAVDGRYVLCHVTHVIDRERGYRCELDTAPPPTRRRPPASNVALGIVTRIKDPKNLGRVRVELPAYGEVETDWMEVVMPGAGAKKGFVALPDVGDHVLVLLSRQDAAQGVVLGGLHGTHGPPDAGIQGGSVKRFGFQTPGGQKFLCDDSKNLLRIENAKGSVLELTPGKVRLSSKADLIIEAPGKSITIKGSRVDFKSG